MTTRISLLSLGLLASAPVFGAGQDDPGGEPPPVVSGHISLDRDSLGNTYGVTGDVCFGSDSDGVLIKYDKHGNVVWDLCMGSTDGFDNVAWDVSVDANDDVWTAVSTYQGGSSVRCNVYKHSPNGFQLMNLGAQYNVHTHNECKLIYVLDSIGMVLTALDLDPAIVPGSLKLVGVGLTGGGPGTNMINGAFSGWYEAAELVDMFEDAEGNFVLVTNNIANNQGDVGFHHFPPGFAWQNRTHWVLGDPGVDEFAHNVVVDPHGVFHIAGMAKTAVGVERWFTQHTLTTVGGRIDGMRDPQ